MWSVAVGWGISGGLRLQALAWKPDNVLRPGSSWDLAKAQLDNALSVGCWGSLVEVIGRLEV